jgi:hypothetical protein
VEIRSHLRRLERKAEGELENFLLQDGFRYYFDPTSPELFLHFCNCATAHSAYNWPEPPEVVRKLCEAKDVKRALEKVQGEATFYSFVYEPEVLINERRLEPRGLVTIRDPQSGEWHVQNPYDEQPPQDLSE